MSVINDDGRELARLLNPFIGTTPEIVEICSRIATDAKQHARYQEIRCNREIRPYEEANEEAIEARITELVRRLPRTDDGPITVRFDGDPRGFTVKLIVPNQPHAGNTWGLGGEYGV